METHGAEILWHRSLKFKVRYTTMLSDDDYKAFNRVNEIRPYSANTVIEKVSTMLANGWAQHCAIWSQTAAKEKSH